MQFPTDARIVAGFLLTGFGLLMIAWAMFLAPATDALRSDILWIGAMMAAGAGGGIMGTSLSISKKV